MKLRTLHVVGLLLLWLFVGFPQLASARQSEVQVSFSKASYFVKEGDVAEIGLRLTAATTEPVTVQYVVLGSSAIPDIDFLPVDGQIVIDAGLRKATLPFSTLHDDKHDGDKRILLTLSNAENATLANRRQAILTIKDVDEPDASLVDDFSGYHAFQFQGAVTEAIEIASVPSNATPQQALMLTVDPQQADVVAVRRFITPQNWQAATGLSFWFYGSGSGQPVTFQLLDSPALKTAETDPTEWQLSWADEFDSPAGTPPNPNHWSYEYGDGTLNGVQGWGNQEFQYYTAEPENVAMDGNGNLAITVQKLSEDTDYPCYYGPCQYSSARIISANKAEFEYGRIEARIKVPDGQGGLWPAFWMLGTGFDEGVAWPHSGEIDIMEYISRRPNEVFGTIHGPGYSGGGGYGRIQRLSEPVAADYHTYAIEWQPNEIRWYLDGEHFHTATPDDVAPHRWVYNQPFFLLLNVAIGGHFGGRINPQIEFPQSMLVDYIRVYQAPDSAERHEVTFVDSQAGWQQIQLPFSAFTRSSQQPPQALSDGLTLSEVTGYRLVLPHSAARFGSAAPLTIGLDEVRLQTDAVTLQLPPARQQPVLLPWLLSLLVLFLLGLAVVNRPKLQAR